MTLKEAWEKQQRAITERPEYGRVGAFHGLPPNNLHGVNWDKMFDWRLWLRLTQHKRNKLYQLLLDFGSEYAAEQCELLECLR